MPPPGLFSKRVGWTANCIRYVGRITNKGKRAAFFCWTDEFGLHVAGSEAMIKKWQQSGDWSDCANEDTKSLANGSQTVLIDDSLDNEALLRSHYRHIPVTMLPCPVGFLSHNQAYKWLIKELKKDLVEQ